MKKNIAILDTNILVRFFTRDNEVHYKKAKALFESAERRSLHVPMPVICEMVFVLTSVYEFDREEICEIVTGMVHFDAFALSRNTLSVTIQIFREHPSLSFIDAYISAKCVITGSSLYTFDKKLHRSSSCESLDLPFE